MSELTHPTTDERVFRERLLNVARALREDPDPPKFCMAFFHDCGTPGCALGHYAARNDLQSAFYLRRKSDWLGIRTKTGRAAGPAIGFDDIRVSEHFGLSCYDEAEELFGTRGCGNAKTPIKAAEYIEAFVERKYPVTV